MVDTQAVGKRPATAKRGAKQTCENDDCRSRFYDLTLTPCTCPFCGVVCDTPAVVILNFETLGKPQHRKFNNRIEPQKPVIEIPKAEENKTEAEIETSPAGEVLMIDDDEDADANEQVSEEESDEIS